MYRSSSPLPRPKRRKQDEDSEEVVATYQTLPQTSSDSLNNQDLDGLDTDDLPDLSKLNQHIMTAHSTARAKTPAHKPAPSTRPKSKKATAAPKTKSTRNTTRSSVATPQPSFHKSSSVPVRSMPSYELWLDAQLAAELKKHGFGHKKLTGRKARIEMLQMCWKTSERRRSQQSKTKNLPQDLTTEKATTSIQAPGKTKPKRLTVAGLQAVVESLDTEVHELKTAIAARDKDIRELKTTTATLVKSVRKLSGGGENDGLRKLPAGTDTE